ncbi:MAG: hypothetical protein CMJ44_07775 [Pimelobacter sp.]|nr:hypothetical protein [Pimelobacter sp.]
MRRQLIVLLTALLLAALALPATPAAAHGDRERIERMAASRDATDQSLQSGNIAHLGVEPSQVGISGCFLHTAPLFVTSGLDSIRVFNVADPANPRLVGVLPNLLFENEAMNCGERRTKKGVRRFVLIGVDLVQASLDDIQHANVGGGELVVVDVTRASNPRILSRTPGSTSTHTVACVDERNCTYAYSAGNNESDPHFSIFDLRRLDRPREVDRRPRKEGLQSFVSPTAGHKWNFDAAGIGTHTGWGGASMWNVDKPTKPRLLTTTGAAGRGENPKFKGWNDFILHNAFRPNAEAFKARSKPSLDNGNILLVTEEDYEQTDCTQAGSFQTWWVKRLDGKKKNAIKPLDKVEISDLGTFPLPVGAFCSSHWFDYRPGGLVATGFYGGGTQILDVRDPRDIRTYAHSVWGLSEVWDAMWVPVYKNRRATSARTNVVYSIDLVRGLDVYAVDVPGDGRGALPPPSASDPTVRERISASAVPTGLVGGAFLLALALAALRRRRVHHAV